jgi:hypothetical protein
MGPPATPGSTASATPRTPSLSEEELTQRVSSLQHEILAIDRQIELNRSRIKYLAHLRRPQEAGWAEAEVALLVTTIKEVGKEPGCDWGKVYAMLGSARNPAEIRLFAHSYFGRAVAKEKAARNPEAWPMETKKRYEKEVSAALSKSQAGSLSPEDLEAIAGSLGKPVDEVKAFHGKLMSDMEMIAGRAKALALAGARKRDAEWTQAEQAALLRGLAAHPGDWRTISENFVPTKTPSQIAAHAAARAERRPAVADPPPPPWSPDGAEDSEAAEGFTNSRYRGVAPPIKISTESPRDGPPSASLQSASSAPATAMGGLNLQSAREQ